MFARCVHAMQLMKSSWIHVQPLAFMIRRRVAQGSAHPPWPMAKRPGRGSERAFQRRGSLVTR